MTFNLRPDWQGLAGRSRAVRAALLVSVVLVVVGLGYIARLHALRLELAVSSDQGLHLHSELLMKGQQAQRFDELQTALRLAGQHLKDARWRLAAGGDMAELIEDLTRLGRAQNLLFEQVDVQASSSGLEYRTIPLSLQVVGRYGALRLWLDQWLGQLRLLRVTQLRLRAVDGDSRLLRLQLEVNAYAALREDLDIPPSLAAEPARPAPRPPRIDPFRRNARQATTHPLAQVALEQVEMVGSLARQGEYQALLRLAGAVHPVRVGDRVGRAEGRVTRIDEQQVQVLEHTFVDGQGWLEQLRYLALRQGAVTEVTDELERHDDDGAAGDLVGASDGSDTGVAG